MFTAKRGGRTYQITDEDQERIRQLALANGGDLLKAISDQFQEKFGEPFLKPGDDSKGEDKSC